MTKFLLFKKRDLKRGARIICLVALLFLIIASVTGTILLFSFQKSETHQISLYTYKQNAKVGYAVNLKDNEIYGAGSLPSGNVYLTPLVTDIDATFSYLFKGQNKTEIKGSYEIIAVVEGSKRVDGSSKTIWTKQYVLVPKTEFTADQDQFDFSRKINIDFKGYSDFAAKAAESLNFKFDSSLTVIMDVSLSADTGQGLIKEKASPAMSFPLNTEFFEVSKTNELSGKEGEIQKTATNKVPINRQTFIFYLLILLLSIAGLCYLRFFTYEQTESNPAVQKMKAILRKYHNRMIALADTESFSAKTHYQVDSLEDLILLSDEAGQPVFFQRAEEAELIAWFGVVVDGDCFIWRPDRE